MNFSRPVLLTATDISKRFGGVQALSEVSLEVRAGEIHGLVGANGAGKSTLIGALSGAVRPDAGRVLMAGEPVPAGGINAARRAGIAVVHQELMLFPDRSVEENIAAGVAVPPISIVDFRLRRQAVLRVLNSLRASIPLDRRAKDLPLAQQQLVEIGRALCGGGSLLILDEPTSALSRPETDGLFKTLRGLAADGKGIVFVSHKLDEIFELTDRMTVLRDGRVMGTWRTSDANLETITRAMVGELAERRPHRGVAPGPVRVSLRKADATGVGPVDLDLRAGEVVGLAGLEGSGNTETLEMLAGVRPARGNIIVDGRDVRFGGPSDAIRAGLVFLPPDRKRQGLWLDRSPLWNVAAADIGRAPSLGLLRSGRLNNEANARLDAVGVRAADRKEQVARFSGGNQQRVMIARCLEMRPRVLLLADFTRGVDVSAKAAIHRIVRHLADEGIAICLTSSDLDELVDVCDRLVFMRAGRKITEGPASDYSRMDVIAMVTTGRVGGEAPITPAA